MKVLVLGAAGMIGRKLIDRLLTDGRLRGKAIQSLHAFDVVEASVSYDGPVKLSVSAGDISNAKTVSDLVASRPDVIFHLAAIVSGEAEADFDKGYRINMGGTQNLFDAILAQDDYLPRVVYASSIAVFGAPFPEKIGDEFHLTPLTSYGTQKAIGELLLADLTRKGRLDGVGLRLPTIVVRPGKPNAAASGFFSNIIREPLAGKPAVLPVDESVMHWVASPRSAVGFCIHAAEIDGEKIGPRRNLTMPGLAVTVADMLAALEATGGKKARDLVENKRDETIAAIVANWPRQFDAQRAEALGFTAEKQFSEIIAAHVDDEMGGKLN